MSLEQDIASLTQASDNLTSAIDGKIAAIDERVNTAETQFELWKASFVENINGVEVFKKGRMKEYFLSSYINTGGYTSEGGPDSDFPACAAPQSPYFINLLEFTARSGFGQNGDIFKVEYHQTHRGMGATAGYTEHLIFTGTTWSDSVAGHLEIVETSGAGLSLFTSEPNNEAIETPITTDMRGTKIPLSFRSISQGYDTGTARISLKIDSRYHCGASRAFGAHAFYTSDRGAPPKSIISQTQPAWDQ